MRREGWCSTLHLHAEQAKTTFALQDILRIKTTRVLYNVACPCLSSSSCPPPVLNSFTTRSSRNPVTSHSPLGGVAFPSSQIRVRTSCKNQHPALRSLQPEWDQMQNRSEIPDTFTDGYRAMSLISYRAVAEVMAKSFWQKALMAEDAQNTRGPWKWGDPRLVTSLGLFSLDITHHALGCPCDGRLFPASHRCPLLSVPMCSRGAKARSSLLCSILRALAVDQMANPTASSMLLSGCSGPPPPAPIRPLRSIATTSKFLRHGPLTTAACPQRHAHALPTMHR